MSEITFSITDLRKSLIKEIAEELSKMYRRIGEIIPEDVIAQMRHQTPNYSPFKKKSKIQTFINFIHLGEIEKDQREEIIRLDAENITQNVILHLLRR